MERFQCSKAGARCLCGTYCGHSWGVDLRHSASFGLCEGLRSTDLPHEPEQGSKPVRVHEADQTAEYAEEHGEPQPGDWRLVVVFHILLKGLEPTLPACWHGRITEILEERLFEVLVQDIEAIEGGVMPIARHLIFTVDGHR